MKKESICNISYFNRNLEYFFKKTAFGHKHEHGEEHHHHHEGEHEHHHHEGENHHHEHEHHHHDETEEHHEGEHHHHHHHHEGEEKDKTLDKVMLTAERIQEMMQNAGLKPLEPMRVYILLIKFV